MKRLTLFAKGNVDVHDSLHSCRVGGELLWNGINAAFRECALDVVARVKHETWTRSDALIASDGTVPGPMRDLKLGTYPLASQFSRALFEQSCDAIVLSIQPDVMSGLLRHRQRGFLFYPSQLDQWDAADRQWLKAEFDPVPPLDASRSMDNLRKIISELREQRATPILVYNLSPIIPGESVSCYEGMEEMLSERIRRFNLGLIDLSREAGIYIVDVDRIVAEHGAAALKRDPIHLMPAGYRLLALEVVRILAECGVLDA